MIGVAAQSEVRVMDDGGQTIVLKAPARRIISLAPHTTEMLYAAGAGDRIVGTVSYSDFPEAAKKLPRVGDNTLLDIERIVGFQPDLLVVWRHGNAEGQLDKLRTFGIPIFRSEPHTLTEIPGALIRFGELAGSESVARQAAIDFTRRLDAIRSRYSERPTVSLFYQVWTQPLLTINGHQIISDVIRACGGENVFAAARQLVPTVDVEAVLAANPEVIVSGKMGSEDTSSFDVWRTFPSLLAVSNNNLILLDDESISRPSPRILEGATRLCEALETVRAKRNP
jgi:iron complex transport system substrate-binding protein